MRNYIYRLVTIGLRLSTMPLVTANLVTMVGAQEQEFCVKAGYDRPQAN